MAQPVDHGSAPVAQPVDHGVIRNRLSRWIRRPPLTCVNRSDPRGDEVDQVGIEADPRRPRAGDSGGDPRGESGWFTVSRGLDEPVDQWLLPRGGSPGDHEPVQEVIREANHDVDQAREPRPSRELIRPSHGSAAAEDRLAELARQTAGRWAVTPMKI